jgi:antitoxin HicB
VNKSHIGGNFDDFLLEEQLLEVADAAAVKRVLAFQVEQEMKKRQLSKTEMASRMKTSRASVERLLDPRNTSVTLATLGRAAAALGKNLAVEFKEGSRRAPRPRPSLATEERQQRPVHEAREAAAPASAVRRQVNARSKPSRPKP